MPMQACPGCRTILTHRSFPGTEPDCQGHPRNPLIARLDPPRRLTAAGAPDWAVHYRQGSRQAWTQGLFRGQRLWGTGSAIAQQCHFTSRHTWLLGTRLSSGFLPAEMGRPWDSVGSYQVPRLCRAGTDPQGRLSLDMFCPKHAGDLRDQRGPQVKLVSRWRWWSRDEAQQGSGYAHPRMTRSSTRKSNPELNRDWGWVAFAASAQQSLTPKARYKPYQTAADPRWVGPATSAKAIVSHPAEAVPHRTPPGQSRRGQNGTARTMSPDRLTSGTPVRAMDDLPSGLRHRLQYGGSDRCKPFQPT